MLPTELIDMYKNLHGYTKRKTGPSVDVRVCVCVFVCMCFYAIPAQKYEVDLLAGVGCSVVVSWLPAS